MSVGFVFLTGGWINREYSQDQILKVLGVMIGDGVTSEYMRDALGSVTGTISSTTGIVANTYRYKPYRSQLGGC